MMMTTANFSPGMDSKLIGRRRFANGFVMLALFAMAANAPAQQAGDVFAPFGELLATSVDNGSVDYPAFARSTAFAEMIADLATTAPARGASREQRLAFYINAYNAVSIQGILDGYSPSTIWSRIRFFKRRKYDLFNTSISLYDLEHERIMNEGEPRIHFAIVCSSKSCPPLLNELYSAGRLDAQLDDVTRRFVNNPASNRLDIETRSAELSRIFDWYRDEFEAEGDGSLQKFVARYVDDPAVRQSLETEDWSIRFMDYDWSLNGTPLNQ